MGRLMGGAIIVEQQEYLMTQGIVLFVATMFIVINLLTDLVYALVDPRLQRDGEH